MQKVSRDSKENKRKKVFVGMSGGVDSSVTATLLQRAGYDVTGVFIRAWEPEGMPCSWRDERRDAMRVCAHLGIPFKTFNFEKLYKRDVVDYLIREYRKGNTPNPDVMCNRYIKFNAFYKKAIQEGADYIATGHYAQILKIEGDYKLIRGVLQEKDQSYFLWAIPKTVLSRVLFPVGGFTKEKTRSLAKKFKLPTASKKDSQGLCFIGKLDIKEFLSDYIPKRRGIVRDEKGKTIGTHNGVHLFTIGERHGFTVTTPHKNPLYVVSKDSKKNILMVSSKYPVSSENKKEINLRETNWLTKPSQRVRYHMQVRYHGKMYPCKIKKIQGSHAVIVPLVLVDALTIGQSCVLYDKKKCLGGGIIE